MLKMLEATIERTENTKALSALNVTGNGDKAQGLQSASSLYRRVAALASELGRIEQELKDSLNWLHDGLCDCPSCLHELRRQRRLIETRNRLLAEMDALSDAVKIADVEEVECVRCCQPFVPIDDEMLCEACWLAENGPRR